MKNVSQIFKAYRKALGARQWQIAQALGVSRTTVSNWERGYTVAPSNRLLELQQLKKDDLPVANF